jgi:hypothetical protein
MGWKEHVSLVGEKRNLYKVLVEIVEENNHLKD